MNLNILYHWRHFNYLAHYKYTHSTFLNNTFLQLSKITTYHLTQRERERKMQAVWVSVKENANCMSRSKQTYVIDSLQKTSNEKSVDFDELHQMKKNHAHQVLFRPNYPITQFQKIDVGDPSRKIIETISRRASIDPSKPSRKISRVLKVKNSVEILERFEKYREKVKKKSCEQQKGLNPRSTVDGNELLRFYGTLMTCKKSTQVSELCKDPFCRVCRIIYSNFDAEHYKKNGVKLSTRSEVMCDDMAALTKAKNYKRAVIVCRIIAGRVGTTNERLSQEFDSYTSEGLCLGDEYLVVKNPCAILPCFVVVFN